MKRGKSRQHSSNAPLSRQPSSPLPNTPGRPKAGGSRGKGWWIVGIAVVAMVAVWKWRSGSSTLHPPASTEFQELGSANGPGPTNSTGLVSANERARLAVNHGNELLASGQVTNAIAAYLDALRLTPEDEDVFYNLGVAYARIGDLDAAEKNYRKALELSPDYAEAHNNLGNALSRLQRLEEAEKELREAIRLLPEFATAHNSLGTLLQRLGRSDQARSEFEAAVAYRPEFWEAWFNLGQALMQQGDRDGAAHAFREVLKYEPSFQPAAQALARLQPSPPLAPPP